MRLPVPTSSMGISEKCRPVGTRDLKTVPDGWPAPIRSAIAWSPSGVPMEFATFEKGRLEPDMT